MKTEIGEIAKITLHGTEIQQASEILDVYKQNGWSILDVTGKNSIGDTATQTIILERITSRKNDRLS